VFPYTPLLPKKQILEVAESLNAVTPPGTGSSYETPDFRQESIEIEILRFSIPYLVSPNFLGHSGEKIFLSDTDHNAFICLTILLLLVKQTGI